MAPLNLSRNVLQAITLASAFALCSCQATSKDTAKSQLGTPTTEQAMIAALEEEGVIVFTKHTAGHWQVPLSGLLNLEHPKAIAADIADREEPIDVYTYSLVHPTAGNYLVDSGISESFRKSGGRSYSKDIAALVNAVMGFDKLELVTTTREISERLSGIDGVFLTHIHMDHILGLTDLDETVPVYIGPGEASLRDFMHAFTQGTTNRLLKRQKNLQELQFSHTAILDVFGDGSLFAVHAPGHTPGTIAYIANTTDGVQLLLGDVTHTRWGWENQVESGTYSYDSPASAESLAKIRALADAIHSVAVHPGHQTL